MLEVADFNGDGLLDLYVVDDGSDKLLTATEHVADTQLGFTTVNLGFPSSNGFGGNVHAADLDLDVDDVPRPSRMAIYENWTERCPTTMARRRSTGSRTATTWRCSTSTTTGSWTSSAGNARDTR